MCMYMTLVIDLDMKKHSRRHLSLLSRKSRNLQYIWKILFTHDKLILIPMLLFIHTYVTLYTNSLFCNITNLLSTPKFFFSKFNFPSLSLMLSSIVTESYPKLYSEPYSTVCMSLSPPPTPTPITNSSATLHLQPHPSPPSSPPTSSPLTFFLVGYSWS